MRLLLFIYFLLLVWVHDASDRDTRPSHWSHFFVTNVRLILNCSPNHFVTVFICIFICISFNDDERQPIWITHYQFFGVASSLFVLLVKLLHKRMRQCLLICHGWLCFCKNRHARFYRRVVKMPRAFQKSSQPVAHLFWSRVTRHFLSSPENIQQHNVPQVFVHWEGEWNRHCLCALSFESPELKEKFDVWLDLPPIKHTNWRLRWICPVNSNWFCVCWKWKLYSCMHIPFHWF